ncbi:hypothetical protein M419DRAFT_120327 [Trichoderma reesei RUT C-30]|uniref:Uncharacterized protein n=1 Tax=Hypocrea jecorina (strain ATCC 56765 / BCRC 32924 / NRRL 11460 / Rut C-30) TaxID=1344414 RepID=A0A024S1P4_HYPJR|nr:hypothetical protein M419DRAFT_120327 [Trichoderma reesei RUT C-30]
MRKIRTKEIREEVVNRDKPEAEACCERGQTAGECDNFHRAPKGVCICPSTAIISRVDAEIIFGLTRAAA